MTSSGACASCNRHPPTAPWGGEGADEEVSLNRTNNLHGSWMCRLVHDLQPSVRVMRTVTRAEMSACHQRKHRFAMSEVECCVTRRPICQAARRVWHENALLGPVKTGFLRLSAAADPGS